MSADRLPERPNLDHLKRQAKDLKKSRGGTLREAQRAVAAQYGFASWDALRDHVDAVTGRVREVTRREPQIDYEHRVPATIPLSGPLTPEVARALAERGVSGVKVDGTIPPATLSLLAEIPSLLRLDLSEHVELADDHLAFLERMPQLTAIAFSPWGRVGDRAVALLVGKPKLSRVTLGPLVTDAGVERLRDFPALAQPVDVNSLLTISAPRGLTDQALATIGTLQGVAGLDVHTSAFGSPLYTAAGAAHLKNMGALEALNFHGHLVTDAVLRQIAAIPRLRWLHAQDTVSGDEGFIALGRCETLEALAMRQCGGVSDRGVAALAGLPRLRSLNVGGRRLTDDAFAPFASALVLRDFSSPMSRDGAFAYIARIPRLERLVNMYNRATTDAATRYLQGHPTLSSYAAFGTQISDDSLRVLSELPSLEEVTLDNLFSITDAGLRLLAVAPKLRRMSVDTCMRVTGDWLKSAPRALDAKFNKGDRGYAEFYRAESLMDNPEMAMPDDVARPTGAPVPDIVPALGCIDAGASFDANGLQMRVPTGGNRQRSGVITREGFASPLRAEMVVRPLSELRIVFGRHNQYIAFNERGDVADVAPWFMRTDEEQGSAQGGVSEPIPDDRWTTVTLEVDAQERRVLIDGRLRHTWRGDFDGFRSRLALGPRQSTLAVKSLRIVAPREP